MSAETQGAELLREAAKLMRERAEAANTDGARTPYGDKSYPPVPPDRWGALVADDYLGGPIGEHCGSWHPAVAVAVADWLDAAGEYVDTSSLAFDAALAVAREFLGRES